VSLLLPFRNGIFAPLHIVEIIFVFLDAASRRTAFSSH
jgi:hypothetical protein